MLEIILEILIWVCLYVDSGGTLDFPTRIKQRCVVINFYDSLNSRYDWCSGYTSELFKTLQAG